MRTAKHHAFNLISLLALAMSADAVDLTVTGTFATDEEVPLVFTYAELQARCSVSPGADRFQVALLESTGTLQIGPTASGPWTDVVAGDYFVAPQVMRFVPSADAYGTKTIMSFRACLGVDTSAARSIDIAIAPLPDPLTAASCIYTTSPVGEAVSEDTPFIFTYADLVDALQVNDPDGQGILLRLTGAEHGGLSTLAGTAITTFPYDLLPGESVRWQGTPDLYTKDDEPPLTALRLYAITTDAPLEETAEVVLSTRIAGVDDLLTGTPTTMGSFDALVVNAGTTTSFTYPELRAKVHGTNDVDRVGILAFNCLTPVGGMIVRRFGSTGTLITEVTAYPALVHCDCGDTLTIFVPDGTSRGLRTLGEVSLGVPSSSGYSMTRDLFLQVGAASGGGTTTAGGGGGGGGCGAGAALGVLVAMLAIAMQMIRKHRP